MVHCSDVGNRLSEFCSTKVHRKAETGKNIPRKSRFVIVGRNIFESHFLFRFLPNINTLLTPHRAHGVHWQQGQVQ